MNKLATLKWTNASIGNTGQRIYRALGDGEFEVLVEIEPGVTEYLDEFDPEYGGAVKYRVSSYFNYKERVFEQFSDTVEVFITPPMNPALLTAMKFTTTSVGEVYSNNPFFIKDMDGNIAATSAYNESERMHVAGNFPAGQYYITKEDPTEPLSAVYFNGGISSLDQWHGAGYDGTTLTMYDTPTQLAFSSTSLVSVPDTLPTTITNLNRTFHNTTSFTGDVLANWDVSNVTNMSSMFYGAKLFNADISGWNVSNVTNMQSMFYGAVKFNTDISGWNVSNVTDMSSMFYNAQAFNKPIGNWNVSSVTNMLSMFARASKFNRDLSGWDVSNVTNMSSMFLQATVFNGNISNWDVSNVTNMSQMFLQAMAFNGNISNWDVSNVTNMVYMFSRARAFNQDLSMWCVSGITNAPIDFNYDSALTEDHLPVWGTCPRGENIAANEVHFVTNGVAYYKGIAGDEIVYSDGTTLPITTNQRVTLKSITGTQKVVLKSERGTSDLNKVICFEGSGITELLNFPKSSEINGCKFYVSTGCANLVKVPTTLPPNITDLSRMFQKCGSFNQDISQWDTSNVTNMSYMFYEANSFNQPIGVWNIGKVTNLSRVFQLAVMFNQDLSAWNTANVTNMSGAFNGAAEFNQPLASWDVSSVTDISRMFQSAPKFNQPLNTWNTSNVTRMEYMFYGASAFNEAIDQWDTSKVTNMGYMFQDATLFNVDISNWNTALVDSMGYMFNRATAFSYSLKNWCVPLITSEPSGFGNGTSTFGSSKYPVWGTCPVNYPTNALVLNVQSGSLSMGLRSGDKYTIAGVKTTATATMSVGKTITQPGTVVIEYSQGSEELFSYITGTAVTEVIQFPTVGNGIYGFSFEGTPITKVPSELPPYITSTEKMFSGCKTFNDPNVKNWDVSNINNMAQMFYGATVFSQDLTGWCVANILTKPSIFNTSSALTTAQLPVWGTCPVPATAGSMIYQTGKYVGTTVTSTEPFSLRSLAGTGTVDATADSNGLYVATTTSTGSVNRFEVLTVDMSQPIKGIVIDGATNIESWHEAGYEIGEFGVDESWQVAFLGLELVKVPDYLHPSITTTSHMFDGATTFNQDLSGWDVSDVTDMSYMFYGTMYFNKPLNGWNVSNVTNIDHMFQNARAFNQDLSNWDVSNVTSLDGVFSGATAFNGDISKWNVSNVTKMISTFQGATVFNGDISNWDVTNVTSLFYAFESAKAFNQPIGKWNTQSVQMMDGAFQNATKLSQDLSKWCVPHITSTPYNFSASSALTTAQLPVWGTCPSTEPTVTAPDVSIGLLMVNGADASSQLNLYCNDLLVNTYSVGADFENAAGLVQRDILDHATVGLVGVKQMNGFMIRNLNATNQYNLRFELSGAGMMALMDGTMQPIVGDTVTPTDVRIHTVGEHPEMDGIIMVGDGTTLMYEPRAVNLTIGFGTSSEFTFSKEYAESFTTHDLFRDMVSAMNSNFGAHTVGLTTDAEMQNVHFDLIKDDPAFDGLSMIFAGSDHNQTTIRFAQNEGGTFKYFYLRKPDSKLGQPYDDLDVLFPNTSMSGVITGTF